MDSEELSVLHMLHPYTVYDCNAAILLMFNEHSEYSVFASELLDILWRITWLKFRDISFAYLNEWE